MGGAEIGKLREIEQHLGRIFRRMQDINEVTQETIKVEKELEKQIDKNRNAFLKAADVVEGFMSEGGPLTVFSRRVVYAMGGYKIINKFNVSLRATGKALEVINKLRPKNLMNTMKNINFRWNQTKTTMGPMTKEQYEKSEWKNKSMMEKIQGYGDFIGEGGSDGNQVARMIGRTQYDKGVKRRQGMQEGMQGIKKKWGETMGSDKWRKKVMGKGLEFMKKGLGLMGHLFKFIIIASFYIALIAVAIAALKPHLKKAWEAAKGGFSKAWAFMVKGGKMFSEGFGKVWAFLKDPFGKGKLEGMIDGLIGMALGLLKIAFGFLAAFVAPLIMFVVGFIKSIGDTMYNYAKKNIGKSLLILGGLILLVVAWLYGFPFVLAGAILLGVWYLGKKLKNMFSFGKHAGGGIVNSNMQLVGEGGPELVSLPRGSRVHTNAQSKKMVSKGGGNTFNITVNANSLADNDLRKVAQKVGQMINREVNRSTSSRTVM